MGSTALVVTVYLLSMFVLCKLFAHTSIVTPHAHGRSSPLDALRGILATAVVCHHMVITYFWKTGGAWVPPQSDVLCNLGYVPVSLFFMITGFLFFGKVYQRTPDWIDILTSRVLRIMPLYLAVMIGVLMLSMVEAHFAPVSLAQLLKEMLKWLVFSGGPFFGFPDSNLITAGAHWTLRYEWLFYLSLPALATLCNRRFYGKYTLMSWVVVAITVAGMALGVIRPMMAPLFLAGFLPVWVKRHRPEWLEILNTRLMGAIAVVMLVDAMALPSFTALQIVTLAVPFLIIASGNDLFGLLAGKGLKALGEISYSLYLTHGLVLYMAFTRFGLFQFKGSELTDFIGFFPLVLGAASVLSVVTFHCFEKPFIVSRMPGTVPESNTMAKARLSS
ncbi:acyltransferase [Pseudomonas sp. dw_358]|uniref:acyltransferase family protein n=1 Tax=Pseudomonas sp. dw_358 TaxID=2720083 RepID=UPI001BD39833|nr:acyltransferase [Pseudomonas sp. dw_358]